jgi:hypothetical protein
MLPDLNFVVAPVVHLVSKTIVSHLVCTQKTVYKVLSRHQNTEQNHNLQFTNKSFENMVEFKYFWTTVTHENWIHKEII